MRRDLERRDLLNPGYTAFNGYVFTQPDCDAYNRIQAEINRWLDAGRPVPDFLYDESHKQFQIIIGTI